MKLTILYLLILLTFSAANAQERDLNYYLEQAKLNSPLIHKNTNDIKIVELDLKQIKNILYKPEINFEAGVLFAPIISHDNDLNRFEWISGGAENYNGFDLAATDGGQYQVLVTLNQPLFTGSRVQNYSNKANITERINQNNINLAIHETEQLVRYQYLLCLKTELEAENSLSALNDLKGQIYLLQKLVDHAIYKQTDLMLMRIEYQNIEIEYHTIQADFKTNLYDLNVICGINDTSDVVIQDVNFELIPDTVSESEFLSSFKLDSLNILTDQMIFELNYKPQINLFADAGLNAVYKPSINRLGFSTGLSLSVPIFDGNQKKIEREKSLINLESLSFEKQNFMTQNEVLKSKFKHQIQSVNEREILIRDQLSSYEQLINAYSKELSLGEISVMDLKNLLKDFAAKKQEYVLLKIEKQILINSYNYRNF